MKIFRFICIITVTLLTLCACSSKTNIHTHTYGSWSILTQPTCNEEGVLVRECACGHTEETNVSALGHAYGEGKVVVEPSCTERGLTNYTCKLCGEVKTAIENKAAHTLTEGYVIDEEHHAKECSVCFAVTGKEDHFYYGGVCIICGCPYKEPEISDDNTTFD